MTETTIAPRVFISHATEDKDRFVVEFARQLRANGIDAWLDQWELKPGDSLVDRIFEEGIKNASAFIVVLSKTSVTKRWVREELNEGFVKRIEDKCRLIPIVLDDCEVPECLRSTLWQRIGSLSDYANELKRIVNAIFGLSDKPPIGAPPAHSQARSLLEFPELQKLDLMILELLCEESVRRDDRLVNDLACLNPLLEAGTTPEEIRDSLTVLGDEYYLEVSHVMGPTFCDSGVSHVRIPTSTFDVFARAKWPEYDDMCMRLASGIVNEDWHSGQDLSQLGAPPRLVDHLVRLLEDQALIKVSRAMGGHYSIWSVSPKLKRALAAP